MSQENVEVLRATLDAWNAGDMERFRQLYDPDVVLRAPRDWPEPGPFVGVDAVMRQFAELRATFDRDSVRLVSDFVAAGDKVVARVDWRGIGRGPRSDMEMTLVWTLRNGLVSCQEHFWDHDEALEAVGLAD